MANKKSIAIIVCNNDTFDTKVIQTTKLRFYRAGMRVSVLWNKPSEHLRRVVDKICSEGMEVKDIVIVIISTAISANRLFQTSDGNLDLYVHFFDPLMEVKDSGNNKLCIMNGPVGKIETNNANEAEELLMLRKNNKKQQHGKNTNIVISHETDFIKDFIPIIFECNGDISKSVTQYQETFSKKITYSYSNPEMQLNFA